jgi:hypothetical protein
MTNLTDKFTTFETQSAAQHAALLAALTTMQDAAHTDVLALGALLGSLDSTLNTINGSIVALVTYLNHLVAMDTNLANVSSKITIINTLLQNDYYDFLDEIRSNSGGIVSRIGAQVAPADNSILGRLLAMQGDIHDTSLAIGTPEGAQGTALELLQDIASCVCKVAGTVPTPPTHQYCDEPFTSTGIAFYPTWAGFGTGVNVAVWSAPLPSDVTFGTEFGLTEDNTELDKAGGWSGVYVWVQSSGPNFGINPLSTVRFPTNQWVALPDVDQISISVGNGESIQVYICIPDMTGDCTLDAATVIFSDSNPGNWDSGDIDVTGVTGVWFGASSHPYGDGIATLYVDDVQILSFAPVPPDGIDSFVNISGTTAKLVYSDGTAAFMALRVCPA